MKKASQILLLVGAILSFVWAGYYFFYGVGLIVAGALGSAYGAEKLVEYLQKIGIDLSQYGIDLGTITIAMMVGIIVAGVFVMLWSGVAIASGVFGLLGRKKQTKTLYICNAVFSTLAGVIVNGVGGVMGMFTLPKREEIDAK